MYILIYNGIGLLLFFTLLFGLLGGFGGLLFLFEGFACGLLGTFAYRLDRVFGEHRRCGNNGLEHIDRIASYERGLETHQRVHIAQGLLNGWYVDKAHRVERYVGALLLVGIVGQFNTQLFAAWFGYNPGIECSGIVAHQVVASVVVNPASGVGNNLNALHQ